MLLPTHSAFLFAFKWQVTGLLRNPQLVQFMIFYSRTILAGPLQACPLFSTIYCGSSWHLLYLMWAICFWVYQLHLTTYWNWLLGLSQGSNFMPWVYSYWQSYSFSPWYSAPLNSPPLGSAPSSILSVLQAIC